ncbi:Serpentine Receptor, class H [Caenorhabditis elegans]|uniref:Serpentine Receptor, class H n=1 Tax=Caenorhabditis elegans TaxID=6239 RepID=O62500_CAEEL|nr:Serpentine Receptor, class H [Caenorhabditis elegans]CAB16538.1 Serpentine Receptor, class H [Caenorhabditis elegans]|eukprot:NP_507229.1 Serpentine Receptor, class H [Caenorhabditis elegans]
MCTWRDSYFESVEFYKQSTHILSSIQCPVNIFATYILLFKTPSSMSKVKFSMLVMHFTFVWLDVYLSILSIPYLLYSACLGRALGVLDYFQVPIPVQIYFGITSLLVTAVAVLLFFEERYNRLLRRDADTQSRFIKRIVYFAINYTVAFIDMLPIILNADNSKNSREKVESTFPCIPASIVYSPDLYLLTENRMTTALLLLGYMAFTSCQILFFFTSTLLYLFNTKSMSPKTSKMQKQLFKALCVQVTVPFVVVLVPCFYLNVSSALEHFDMIFINIALLILQCHGLVSTLTTLWVHKPYREATLNLILFKNYNLKVLPSIERIVTL